MRHTEPVTIRTAAEGHPMGDGADRRTRTDITWLEASCSAFELYPQLVERPGIEPGSSACDTDVFPLDDRPVWRSPMRATHRLAPEGARTSRCSARGTHGHCPRFSSEGRFATDGSRKHRAYPFRGGRPTRNRTLSSGVGARLVTMTFDLSSQLAGPTGIEPASTHADNVPAYPDAYDPSWR